jgi:CO/xanthine dehydrogenase Mo-binding subunit
MSDTPEARYYTEGIELPETEVSTNLEPWDATTVVGQPRPRVDGYERVSGTAVYPADITMPGMLYGAILRCPHPHAMVTSVDVTRAKVMPGVRAVLTAFTPPDRVTLPHADLIRTQLFDPHCQYQGEAVAAVAAETPYQARDALRAIEVQYDVQPFLADERRGLEPDAPKVRDEGNAGRPQRYSRGDVERGFAEADVVLEEEYRTECEIHTPMEAHTCVARWDGDRLSLWESTQGVYNVQMQVAAALGMPFSMVRVVGHYMGGGFGSKLQAGKYSILSALLAKMTAKPVKIVLSREETFLAVGNRPSANIQLKAGVKKDGTITALQLTASGASGSQPAGGVSGLDFIVRDLYTCANVRTELQDRYINAGPARPFRAPGHPQCAWAMEQMMDALAKAIDMDPVAFRVRNVPTVSQARGNIPYTTTGLRQCLEDGAKAFGWNEARAEIARSGNQGTIRRGVGVAAGLWAGGGGGPPSTITVKFFADGSVNLNMGASDIGTGTKTVMAMVVAEELGVDPDGIEIEHADTGSTQFASASGGSKTVPTESPAVRAAAVDVKRQLLEIAAEELKVDASTLALRDGKVVSTADPAVATPLSELRGLRRQRNVVGVGYRGPNPRGKAVTPFAAQFCEVEVNTATGEVKVVRFLGAHDSGRAMDRLTYQNQVFGGITMGIGYGMTEQRILDVDQTGKMVNLNWHDYKLPTMLDVPADMTCVVVDPQDKECNSTGAKGIGEPATIPTAPAVANAIYHATGVRVTDTPVDPLHLVAALARTEEG